MIEDSIYLPMQSELERIFSSIDEADVLDSAQQKSFNGDFPAWRHVFAVSPFVTSYVTRFKDRLHVLIASRLEAFDAVRLKQQLNDRLDAIADSVELDRKLRQFRNEQMVLIAIRDLQELAPLGESLLHLSALADMLIEASLRWHYEKLAERHGYPLTDDGEYMPLVVLGMGKLGAEELNFSSDIDLILSYEKDGMTNGKASIEHHQFFIRLAQRFYQSLNKTTEDGFVFRVDLRLRPYGNDGPLVMSFGAMEEYYQTQGREWERYVMIKARAIGMDVDAGLALLDTLQPFVFRRYLDFGVIQSLRDLKVMIDQETVKKDRQDNLKLGPGGIREVEFIAQVFQLMRGGQDTALRSRSTPLILQRLAERELLTSVESAGLITAWRFLRNSENHIQAMYDRQEHALPTSEVDQQRLALSMGYDNWPDFLGQLSIHRQFVQQCFDSVFAENGESEEKNPTRTFWLDICDETMNENYLVKLGYAQPRDMAHRLHGLKLKGVYGRLSERGQTLMDDLMPAIIELAVELEDPDETLTRLLSVITAIARVESLTLRCWWKRHPPGNNWQNCVRPVPGLPGC